MRERVDMRRRDVGLLAQRLERARKLLALHPDRPLIDIALCCGIESQAVFYRAFRQTFAMTPGEYRREARETVVLTARGTSAPADP